MNKLTTTIAGVALTVAMLATAVPAQATASSEILNACLAEAEKASDPKAARNHCIWRLWEYMASYG